jgi:polyhydroxyalkanoate synthase subunit PhaC
MPSTPETTALDALLVGAAPVSPRGLLQAGGRVAAALAARPTTVARRAAGLAAELATIGLGRSTVPLDGRRYADGAWSEHPLLRRVAQVHTAAAATLCDLIDDAGVDAEPLRTAAELVAGATAPSNTLLNPVATRAVLATRGTCLARGAARLALDLATRRVPYTPRTFRVGADVAGAPGAVVLRTPVFELIQYLPRTETVREIPLLVVPPLLNRHYIVDLAPGHSLVDHLVHAGQQVFVISWRNAGAEHAAWDLDTYGQAVLDALDACERITRTHATSLMGICGGGTVTAMVLAHLAAISAQHRVAAVTFAATVLDHTELPDGDAARAAVAASERYGALDGSAVAAAAAWRRPDDLIWPVWVARYLSGGQPSPSEALFWQADTLRMPAGLHRDLVDLAVRNALASPGAATMLGTPVDLAKVDTDSFLIAGRPSAQPLGGQSTVVRSHAEDVVGLVCGDWWDGHAAWLAERSGQLRDAPPELGGRGLHALLPAPGDYVLGR